MTAAFDENLDRARQSEADIEALLDNAKRDAAIGKAGAFQEAERLQALLDATHDPVAAERLFDDLVDRGVIDENGDEILDEAPAGDGEELEDEPDEEAVPEGNIEEVLAWVHGGEPGDEPTEGWRQRAERALQAEETGADRKGVTEPLRRALAEAPESPQEAPDGTAAAGGAPDA